MFKIKEIRCDLHQWIAEMPARDFNDGLFIIGLIIFMGLFGSILGGLIAKIVKSNQ